MDDKQLILIVHNEHTADFINEFPLTNEGRYVSYFVDEIGDQWLFVYDYRTGEATVSGGDVDWETYPVTEYTSDTGESTPNPEVLLDPAGSLWLQACWRATKLPRENLAARKEQGK